MAESNPTDEAPSDQELAKLAADLPASELCNLAVKVLGFTDDKMETMKSDHTNMEASMRKILIRWRNKEHPNNSKRRLAELLTKDESINPESVLKALNLPTKTFHESEQDGNLSVMKQLQELQKKIEKLETEKTEQKDTIEQLKAELQKEKSQQEKFHSIVLQLKSTHPVKLEDWHGFTMVPSTGQVVVYGRGEGDTKDCLHIYTPDGAKDRKIKAPSPNMVEPQLVVMQLDGQETLVASYKTSKKIYLEGLTNQLITVAFHNKGYNLPLMCKGEGDIVFVYSEGFQLRSSLKHYELSEYNCSTVPFKQNRTLKSVLDECFSMCYLPAPYKTLVLSDMNTICSFSVERDDIVWEFSGKFNGLMIRPKKLLFHSSLGLLVYDVENTRILMLAPHSGKILMSFNLDSVGEILDLCLYEEKIVMLHNDNGRKMSFFTLK